MTKGISEVTDERGVTHHIRGYVRFVRLPKRRRRRNPARQGHYVTEPGCVWWCTMESIPAGTLATPGRTVDCMTCLVNPPEKPSPRPYEGTITGRMSFRNGNLVTMGTPSGRETQVFDVNTRSTRSIRTGRRVGRRR